MKTNHLFFKKNHRTAVALAMIAALVVATGALAAAGALDTTFDTDGKVTTSIGSDDDYGFAIALQPDGKIIVAGYGSGDFALTRYNSDGSLDTTFDTDGKVTTNFGGNDVGHAVVIQTDGKIVVTGWSSTGVDYDFALARYNTNGSLDATFDSDGKVTTEFSGMDDFGLAIAFQSDGKIIVAGHSYTGAYSDFALARYNTNGSLDTTFDADGKVITDFGANDTGNSIAIQSDGKIVVAGWYGGNSDFALARYNTNGSLDTTFDADGKVITDFGANDTGNSIAIQSDGKIVVAGYSSTGAYSDFALARYNTNGSLDTTFDADGKVTTDFGSNSFERGDAVALQPDGKIVVAGLRNNGNNDFALARYNADGSLDTTFDSDGKLTTDFGSSDDSSKAVALQPDGKIIVAGDSWNGSNYDFALARYDGGATPVDVYIGANNMGSYDIPASPSLVLNYTNKLDGPVKVVSMDGTPIFTSQRAFYGNSFNELMGFPANQFTTEYWFPWYDNVFMQTWILVGNPSTTDFADVEIYIGGGLQMTTSISPNGRVTPMFGNVLNGPVRVVCTNCASYGGTIFASERSLYGDSFSEVMGYPDDQLTTEYWFPWYDQVYMQTWILVGNPSSTQTAYVDIYIGGQFQMSSAIPPDGRITPQFTGQLNGPVQVVSTTGAGTPTALPIFASERSLYGTSFNEVMGYPRNQFTTEYFFPWYDNTDMQTWILVGNPSSTETAYIEIYIAGQLQQSTSIAPNGRITPTFPANTGPVRVVSTTGAGTPVPIDIFTSERSLYLTSFNEMMAFPVDQLTTEYWFTWYDNVFMNTDLLLSKP